MEHNEQWLQWAVELQALAQAGLTYGKDVYDRERYQRIREIAAEMVALKSGLSNDQVRDLFCEEAGLDVRADLVIAVQDREKHNRPVYANKICKIFFLCTCHGGEFIPNSETTETGYFGLDELPVLATAKVTKEQIKMCFDARNAEHWVTVFD